MAQHRLSRPSISETATSIVAVIVVGGAALLATVPPAAWELDVFEAVNGLPNVSSLAWWPVMQLGSLGGAVLCVLAVAAWRGRRLAGAYALAAGLAWLAAQALKIGAGRSRPAELAVATIVRGAEAVGKGFPSGHAAVAFAAATIIAVELRGWWRAIPLLLAVTVAATRLYVGAHLPLDVFGGAALGLALGLIVHMSGAPHLRGTSTTGPR
jgi:undecaprenyl-diphosphatase